MLRDGDGTHKSVRLKSSYVNGHYLVSSRQLPSPIVSLISSPAVTAHDKSPRSFSL